MHPLRNHIERSRFFCQAARSEPARSTTLSLHFSWPSAARYLCRLTLATRAGRQHKSKQTNSNGGKTQIAIKTKKPQKHRVGFRFCLLLFPRLTPCWASIFWGRPKGRRAEGPKGRRGTTCVDFLFSCRNGVQGPLVPCAGEQGQMGISQNSLPTPYMYTYKYRYIYIYHFSGFCLFETTKQL